MQIGPNVKNAQNLRDFEQAEKLFSFDKQEITKPSSTATDEIEPLAEK